MKWNPGKLFIFSEWNQKISKRKLSLSESGFAATIICDWFSSRQISTQISRQISKQISSQITRQISTQISSQISWQISKQISRKIQM